MGADIEVVASAGVLEAIGRFARTEDVKFSPDGSCLAVAGFGRDKLFVVDITVDCPGAEHRRRVHLTRVTEYAPASLHEPHGLDFVDDRTLVVANRAGGVPVLRLDGTAPRTDEGLSLLHTMRADDVDELCTPGSVATARVAPDVSEILLCNTYANCVTRHVVDTRNGFHGLGGNVLLREGLSTPDGVAVGDGGRWIAVSNHDSASVLMFENLANLNERTSARGELKGLRYPHGLCFTAAGDHVLVADAGAPFIHVFGRGDGDWSGDRWPIASLRAMDDVTFERGHYNPAEGGPKGIDVLRTAGIVAVTSHYTPLLLFDLDAVLAEGGAAVSPSPTVTVPGDESRTALLWEIAASRRGRLEAVALRAVLGKTQSRADVAVDRQRSLEESVAAMQEELDGLRRELEEVQRSRSWRITAPLRWIATRARRMRRRTR